MKTCDADDIIEAFDRLSRLKGWEREHELRLAKTYRVLRDACDEDVIDARESELFRAFHRLHRENIRLREEVVRLRGEHAKREGGEPDA